MYLCYVDESGGFEIPGSDPSATPLMVILGLILGHTCVPDLTLAFLGLKSRFYASRMGPGRHLDRVLVEVKGADVRSALRASDRGPRRRALGYLEDAVRLLEAHHVRLVGRVWVKAPGQAMDPAASCAFAVQDIAAHFNHFLASRGSLGSMICDSRMHTQNSQVSHSVFTQKHKLSGDAYPCLVETPAFGHSVNHVGLQLADLVASSVVFPMASRTYCADHWTGPHVHPHYDGVKQRWASESGCCNTGTATTPASGGAASSSATSWAGVQVSACSSLAPTRLTSRSPQRSDHSARRGSPRRWLSIRRVAPIRTASTASEPGARKVRSSTTSA